MLNGCVGGVVVHVFKLHNQPGMLTRDTPSWSSTL